MTRYAFSMLLVSILAGCTHARCAPGEVPNDTLQACVPTPRCDGGMVNDRNECVMTQAEQADSGAHTQGASAGGQTGARSTTPALDPTIEWMCMKDGAGSCTSCDQDADCPKHVCEHSYCMECRDPSQCGAANSCIANRCVPERQPTNLWATSAGGQTSTTGFKLQMSVGAPTPSADAMAPGFRLSVAPGAGSF